MTKTERSLKGRSSSARFNEIVEIVLEEERGRREANGKFQEKTGNDSYWPKVETGDDS